MYCNAAFGTALACIAHSRGEDRCSLTHKWCFTSYDPVLHQVATFDVQELLSCVRPQLPCGHYLTVADGQQHHLRDGGRLDRFIHETVQSWVGSASTNVATAVAIISMLHSVHSGYLCFDIQEENTVLVDCNDSLGWDDGVGHTLEREDKQSSRRCTCTSDVGRLRMHPFSPPWQGRTVTHRVGRS